MEEPMKERGKKQSDAGASRGGGPRSVGDMLPAVGGTAFRRFGFVQSSVVSRWREIVGERYADVSTPESIRFPAGKREQGVLTLMVDGAHAPMMQHVAPSIVERVNRFFGYAAVARLTIRQGHVTPPEPKRVAPPSLRPVPTAMGDSLRAVADPELRACLAALAGAVAASTGLPSFDEDPACAS
jgi:hypothetical protein